MIRITFAVFIGLSLSAVGAMAACPNTPSKGHPTKTHQSGDNCVNLSTVPQISAEVVGGEPAAAVVKAPAYELPSSGPYEGPTAGMAKLDPGVKPAPTVGYHWNLQ
jgi:hypothetical protein